MKLEKEIVILQSIENYFNSSFPSVFAMEWNNEKNELVIIGNSVDVYISVSAGDYLSVVVDRPFSKKLYYVFDTTTPKALEFILEELEK